MVHVCFCDYIEGNSGDFLCFMLAFASILEGIQEIFYVLCL